MPLFFFNDTATTEIYTLSLHDALPISLQANKEITALYLVGNHAEIHTALPKGGFRDHRIDRKSTRLNSSHITISYAVFCLKKKKKKNAGQSSDRKHL